MANKFLLYRKNPPGTDGIVTEGEVVKSVAGVVGVYDTAEEAPQNMNTEKEPHVLVEYDYDPTVDTTFNLILNAAENGFDKKWTGKTVAEQLQAHHDEQLVQRYKEKKALLKKQINLKASTLIERQEGWRLERAKQQDFLAGNSSKVTAAYQAIEDVRVASNVEQDKLKDLDPNTQAGRNALDAFNPMDWGSVDTGANPAEFPSPAGSTTSEAVVGKLPAKPDPNN